MNTVKIIIREENKQKEFVKKTLRFLFALFGAMVITWVPVILFYEIPCTIGKYYDVDLVIVKTALQAEQKITMKYRTKSYSVNKIIHELEEIKEFYSRI